MKLTTLLTAAAVLGLAGSAQAQVACSRPAAPAVVDGATATMEQVIAAKSEVSAFMAASDTYQTCVLDGVAAKKAAAKAAKTPVDAAAIKADQAAVDANQDDKVKVGAAFNATVKAYKAAHPS